MSWSAQICLKSPYSLWLQNTSEGCAGSLVNTSQKRLWRTSGFEIHSCSTQHQVTDCPREGSSDWSDSWPGAAAEDYARIHRKLMAIRGEGVSQPHGKSPDEAHTLLFHLHVWIWIFCLDVHKEQVSFKACSGRWPSPIPLHSAALYKSPVRNEGAAPSFTLRWE